jgi:hypothetical protein
MFRRAWRLTTLLLLAVCTQLLGAPALADPNAAGRSAAGVFETLIKLLVSPSDAPLAFPHRASRPRPDRTPPHALVRAPPPPAAPAAGPRASTLPALAAARPAPAIRPASAPMRQSDVPRHRSAAPAGLVLEAGISPAIRCNPALVVCSAQRQPGLVASRKSL